MPVGVTLGQRLKTQILLDEHEQMSPIYLHLKKWSQNKTWKGRLHYLLVALVSSRHQETCGGLQEGCDSGKGNEAGETTVGQQWASPPWERLGASSPDSSLK